MALALASPVAATAELDLTGTWVGRQKCKMTSGATKLDRLERENVLFISHSSPSKFFSRFRTSSKSYYGGVKFVDEAADSRAHVGFGLCEPTGQDPIRHEIFVGTASVRESGALRLRLRSMQLLDRGRAEVDYLKCVGTYERIDELPPVPVNCAPNETRAAQASVRETVDEVQFVLARDEWSVGRRRAAVQQIGRRRFDFDTISRLVLGSFHEQFDPRALALFDAYFASDFSRRYATLLARFERQRVAITGARIEPNGQATVLTRVPASQADGVEMKYRLNERTGDWRVIDVSTDGVSLVLTIRAEFAEILDEGGPDLLIDRLRLAQDASEAPF